jgi:hypothetical protein
LGEARSYSLENKVVIWNTMIRIQFWNPDKATFLPLEWIYIWIWNLFAWIRGDWITCSVMGLEPFLIACKMLNLVLTVKIPMRHCFRVKNQYYKTRPRSARNLGTRWSGSRVCSGQVNEKTLFLFLTKTMLSWALKKY